MNSDITIFVAQARQQELRCAAEHARLAAGIPSHPSLFMRLRQTISGRPTRPVTANVPAMAAATEG